MGASPIDDNVAPPPEGERPPLTVEERLATLEQQVNFLLAVSQSQFQLIEALGRTLEVKLERRQTPGGVQLFWSKAGRIVLPGGRG